MRRKTFLSLGIIIFLLIGGGISYLLNPWGNSHRSRDGLTGVKDDQGGTNRVEPILITETIQATKSEDGVALRVPKVLLRIPKAIADPIFKSLEAPEIVGDPFHGIHFEISTVDGKNVHID